MRIAVLLAPGTARFDLVSRTLAALGCTLLAAGCVQPEYPDNYAEVLQPATSADAAQPAFAAVDAVVVRPSADAGSPPGSETQGPLPGAPGGGGQAGGSEAGTVVPPTRADASVAPEASTPTEHAPDSGTQATGGVLGSCSISASTDASDVLFYSGKYGCAVWIGDASKKVIKAFFLATRISSRSGVSAYRSAATGVSVDVVAGATLGAPKQHQYSWDLMGVSPGKYTLNVETHSSGGDATVSVPFELGSAPVSAMGSPAGGVRSASITCK